MKLRDKNGKVGNKNFRQLLSMPPKGGNPDLTDQDILKVLEYMRERFVSAEGVKFSV